MDDFSDPPKKNTRRPTSLKKFTSRCPDGQKFRVDIDSKGDLIGPYANKFKTYLGVVARTKISILPMKWSDVDEETKTIAWDDVKLIFDVPESNEFKKAWMSHISLCWRLFKTTLTRTYVFGSGDNDGQKNPCHKYSNISLETWAAFANSRITEEFVAKREAVKNIRKNNKYNHTMGPGGYKKLKKNLKEKQIKKIKEESGDPDLEVEPTSPERHELWKAGRQSKSGSYACQSSASVGSKIDELAVLSSQGSFVPQGKNDILTVAIGTPEHPGRVRGVGKGVGIKRYFGGVTRTGPGSSQVVKAELMKEIMKDVEVMVQDRVRKVLEEHTISCGGLQHAGVQVPSPNTTVGSKASHSPPHAEEEVNIDWMKEMLVVGYADKRHAKIMLEHEAHECFVSFKEILDMVSGEEWLEMSHLALWSTYLHRQCLERGIGDLYGFVCPYKLNLKHYSINVVLQNIQEKLMTTTTRVYITPFCHSGHWQLIILIPNQNTVVWMCSLGRKPNKEIKGMLSKAVKGYSTSAPTWLYPTMPIQRNGYHCGYYVMKFMLTIVNAGIVDNWEQVFDDSKAYTEEEIFEVRLLWSEFFMKIHTEQKDTLFKIL